MYTLITLGIVNRLAPPILAFALICSTACGNSSGPSQGGGVSISLNAATATVNQGAQKQFSAIVSGSSDTGVNWSVPNGTGTITPSGLFTAPNLQETDTVQAQSQADTTKIATATVTVPAVAISISPTSATVQPNGTKQFSATVTGTVNQNVSWTESGNGSVSSSGLYAAPNAAESDTVTVSSAADPTKSATASVTVGVAQGNCGDTLNWTSPTCQQTASGPLNTAIVNGVNDPNAWTVISRHGEYSQSETECNVPGAISTGSNGLVITTTASSYTCGDFDPTTGTPCSAAAGSPCPDSYPYSTGDLQWNTFNLKFGTIVFQATYPSASTGLWPSHWMLTTKCQTSNKYTGDTGMAGCPNFGATGYDEVDIIECYSGSCRMNVYHNGSSNDCFFPGANWDSNPHMWMWIWTSSAITLSRDGTQICNITSGIPQSNLFMLIQTQTGGVGGTPVNSKLPATLTTKFVKVCDTTDGSCANVANNDPSVTFYDGFQ